MIDVGPILALLDLDCELRPEHIRGELQAAIVEVVKATNAELERIVRELFERFGRDVTAQDIAAVLAKPVKVSTLTGDYREADHMACAGCDKPLSAHRVAGGDLDCPYFGASDGGAYP